MSPAAGLESVAPTSSDNHIPVFFQDDIGVVVKVKNRDSVQLGWRAAWFGDILGIHKVNLWRDRRGKAPSEAMPGLGLLLPLT